MKKFSEMFYLIVTVLTFIIISIGSTYAYFAATVKSEEDQAVATASASFTINLSVFPKFPNPETGPHTIITMKDELSEKGYIGYNETPCIDKTGAAVCYIYEIKVFDFSPGIEYVSGSVKVNTDNISNLSYRVYDANNNPVELKKDEEENSIYYDRLPAGEEKSLGDSHEVKGKQETTLYLMVWVSDIGIPQNETDIGTFTGDITFYAGKGGQITGKISSYIEGSYVD